MTQTLISQSSYLSDERSQEIIKSFFEICKETDYRKKRALLFVQRKRVLHVSINRFVVESKKYLKTLKKPSELHIIQKRLNAPEYDLACDCIHSGAYPSPFNLCSHSLAVLLALCLKQGDTQLLLLREDHRLEDLQKIKGVNEEGIPIRGNEYPEHTKQKKRIFELLQLDQWERVEYEREVHCHNPHTKEKNKHPYSMDVFASRHIDGQEKRIGVEIYGSKPGQGHGSKITIPKDRNRAEEIKDQFEIQIIPLWIENLKVSDDMDILKEIYKAIGY